MIRKKGKEIVFIRHGQSVYNAEGRFYGWHDPDLTDLGREQAAGVAARIKDFINPDMIICSDLKRAYNTAKPIADVFGLEPIKFEGLREVNNGKWEGMTIDDLRVKYPDDLQEFIKLDKAFRFPDGENYEDVCNRASKVFYQQLEKCESLIMVAHYGTIGSLLSKIFFGNPISKNVFFSHNSTIIKFELIGDKARLHNFNC